MNFDLTPHHELHASIGLHDRVQPMVGIYESHLWPDKQSARKHYLEDLPATGRWLERAKALPNCPIMLDIESLNSSSKPHSKQTFDWFSSLVRQIKEATGSPVYWYGNVYEPRSRFEWSYRKSFQRIDAWRESSLRYEIDGLLVANYIRWNHRETDRMRIRANACDMAGIPAIAIYQTAFHSANVDSKSRKAPMINWDIKNHLELLQDIYQGVALWSPPTSYEPTEHRKQLLNSRLYALEILN